MGFNLSDYLRAFRNRRIAAMIFLGFSSGLPLALTGGTLQAWMAVEGVNVKTIGILSLIGMPYTLKFLWSPLMDRFTLPWFGRRRGWIIASQAALMAGISAMAFGSPGKDPWLPAAMALVVAFLSASQDIVVDAYRTDILHEEERGIGSAVFVTGYRIAMLVSGALAMILSEIIGWPKTYFLMAALMTIGAAAAATGPEPEDRVAPPKNMREAVLGPFMDFISRNSALNFIFLIVLYKLGDAYAGSMLTAFLIKGLGFSAGEVGAVNKGFGLAALIAGATLGGALMVRFGLFRSLLFFGLIQGASILSFTALAVVGKNYPVMIFAVAFENFTGGMGTSAFIALLMAICSQKYSATQFALLSSLSALGRVFIAPTSGFVVEVVGWSVFFVIAAFTAVPGLILLAGLRKEIEGLGRSA